MSQIQTHRLAGLVTLIDEGLAKVPPLGELFAPGWDERRVAHNAAVGRFADTLTRREQATIRLSDGGAEIVLANLRSSATSGLEGAIRNWRGAARARLDRERGELVEGGAS